MKCMSYIDGSKNHHLFWYTKVMRRFFRQCSLIIIYINSNIFNVSLEIKIL